MGAIFVFLFESVIRCRGVAQKTFLIFFVQVKISVFVINLRFWPLETS